MTAIAVYGRTYLDAQVEVPLATLASGKGKVATRVTVGHGGFACNAARALAGRFPDGAVRVVTVSSWLEWPRVRASLPAGVALDAIVTADDAIPPVSVILNPAAECRILRDPMDHDGPAWRVDRVAQGALAARLHILGRVPLPFASGVLACARAADGRVAWVGGDALPEALERELDVVCVNSAEASRLLRGDGTPRELADALLARAQRPGAVRVVTGGGRAATAASVRDGARVRRHDAAPAIVPRARITRLLGTGDLFAATFLAEACFDRRGRSRPRLAVEGALRAAQDAAGRFVAGRRAR